MNGKNDSIRRINRKYSRIKRQKRLQDHKKQILFSALGAVILLIVIVWIWFATQPDIQQPETDTLRICVLDVGQGDAVLLQTAEHSVLIDGGDAEQEYQLLHMLKSLHVTSLDAVINSHPHADHIGGINQILQNLPVEALYFPDIPQQLLPTTASYLHVLETAQERAIPIIIPHCHDTLSLGCAELEFLCTDNSQFEDLNNCSLGCHIMCGDVSMFLAGDLEQEGETAFLAENLLSPATIMKVSHHGSNSSSGEELLTALKPKYAVISCGALNDYGHPAQKCLQRLRDAGCTIYRTDLDETVIFTTDGQNIQTQTHVDFGF